ncbi:hypothetical protein SCHPADRAFT_13560 [Schizopora paradoxa]|uniref:Uncharacterized protein n=1 Tax=Schizopora paradoxa TaxID=27342 RepID=A0A0H2SU06_9AGAM|nr:hypothetical protein SCHPADRAFT_13560 [Schizopora paradoxa]
MPSSDGHIYFTFQECHESSNTKARGMSLMHNRSSVPSRSAAFALFLPFAAYFARRSTRHSYAMDDYRSSSLYRGDSSYAPSSSAYFNPSISPAPSSALDIDGRVVFKRQRVREDSPERSQDIRDWVRGVECRRQAADVSTPNSFVEEHGSLCEQPTNESYLRTSPCHVPEPFTSSPLPCPLPERMANDYVEDDSSFSYPSRCSSTTLEHASSAPARPAAVNDPGMQSFLSWLADEDEDTSKLPPRFQDSPPVAADFRCYDEDCMCSNCTSYRSSSEQTGFRPPPLEINEFPVSSYRGEVDDGNIDEMWSPPSLLSSSSSPPFRQSPQSCSPSSEFRTVWKDDNLQEATLHHANSTYTPEFLSFSPFTTWNNIAPDVSTTSLDSPASASFSHIPLHQPQPVRPIVLIRAPLFDSIDEQMCDDTDGSVKFPLRSSKTQRRRRDRNSNLITSIA